MPTADSDGVDIGYEIVGTDTSETVVFVSGLGYGRWLWEWQRPAVEDDYQVILWDLRGIGESDTPEGPYAIAGMAGDLEAVLADAGVEEAPYRRHQPRWDAHSALRRRLRPREVAGVAEHRPRR